MSCAPFLCLCQWRRELSGRWREGKFAEGRPSGAFGRVFLETPKTEYNADQSRCFLHLSLLFLDTLWLFITLNQQNIDTGVHKEQKK